MCGLLDELQIIDETYFYLEKVDVESWSRTELSDSCLSEDMHKALSEVMHKDVLMGA